MGRLEDCNGRTCYTSSISFFFDTDVHIILPRFSKKILYINSSKSSGLFYGEAKTLTPKSHGSLGQKYANQRRSGGLELKI